MSDSVDDTQQESDERFSRRELLKKAGVGAAALGAAGAAAPFSFAGPMKYTGRWLSGNLSAITWVHFVPSYDAWLDPWAKAWGEANDVQVTIEHINNTLLDTRAAAEVAAQQGHDLFFNLHPMAAYEDQVIDHKPIIQEVSRKMGAYLPIAQASTYNVKTKKYFAVSDSYVPDPVVWRYDLWTGVGYEPNTWENILKAAPKLKQIGHPIGIGQSQELDSNMALYAFLMCFGSFLQNANNRPDLNTKKTVAAVNFMAQLYKTGEDFGDLRLEPRLEQQLPLRRHGVADPQRHIGDTDAGIAQPAVLQRPLDLADPHRAERPPRPGAPHGLLEHLEVLAEQGERPEVPRRPPARREAGDDPVRLYNFPTFARRRSRFPRSARSRRPTRTSRRGSTRSSRRSPRSTRTTSAIPGR